MLTRNAPRGDDLDVGLQAIEGELETDLVVALAGAAVRDVAEMNMNTVPQFYQTQTYSQPSRSATLIIPRAMTGRANEVPRR